MTTFKAIGDQNSLTDVLKAFPRNSAQLLRLTDDVMGGPGELSRGEREAIAAFVSRLNDVGYCDFYHTLFSEILSGPIADTDEKLAPLMTYARHVCQGSDEGRDAAFLAALDAGWSEQALYETVEVCGLFNYINCIVRAAKLHEPVARPEPLPTPDELLGSYKAMAKGLDRG